MDLTNALAICLDNIEYEAMSQDDCLKDFPEYANDLRELLQIVSMLRGLAKSTPVISLTPNRYEQFLAVLKTQPQFNTS